MNWHWAIRSGDGGMNGLEFTKATTAGDFSRVLIHAAPAQMQVEIRRDDDRLVARGDAERQGEYSPMTLLTVDGGNVSREEIWPDDSLYGTPVLVAGGEVGVLQQWEHSDDKSWWRWSVEFSNHKDRPADWSPEGQELQR